MSRFIRLAVAGLCCAAGILYAEENLIFELDENTEISSRRGKAVVESGVLKTKLPALIYFPARRKIDPSKVYTLSAEFRVSGGATKDNLWLGFVPYDAKGREIFSQTYNRLVPATLGEVAADAKKGDAKIVVRGNLDAWKPFLKNSDRFLALDAKADGSDMPNTRLLRTVKGFTERDDGSLELTLHKPLAADLAAGTPLALHTWGVSYQVVSPRRAKEGWNKITGRYRVGKKDKGVAAFCPGAASVAIAFFCRDKEGEIEIRNLQLLESDK